MKVFELAAIRGVNAKDLAKELGLKSHLSIVPEELHKDIPETVVVSVPSFTEPVVQSIVVSEISKEDKIKSIRGLGVKSKFWNERESLGLK